MKNKLFFLLFLATLFFSSCATWYRPHFSLESSSYPPLNTKITKHIGDIMVSQFMKTCYPAINIKEDMKIGSFTIKKGLYECTREYDDVRCFEPASGKIYCSGLMYGAYGAIGTYDTGKNPRNFYVGAYNGFDAFFKYNKLPFGSVENTQKIEESARNFQQTLIYTGIEGDIVKFSYREFSGDLARPAFTIDVTYDLSESSEILFRNAVIEVIEASSNSITYIIKKNFNNM